MSEVADADAQGKELYAAAGAGNEEDVAKLLEDGADVNWRNGKGNAALHAASLGGHEGVMKMLLDKGAVIDQTDAEGWTPLNFACLNGKENAVRVLLDAGSKSASDAASDGRTPLHVACQWGHWDIARLLLKSGCRAHLVDQHGQTAFHMRDSVPKDIKEMMEAVRNEVGRTVKAARK